MFHVSGRPPAAPILHANLGPPIASRARRPCAGVPCVSRSPFRLRHFKWLHMHAGVRAWQALLSDDREKCRRNDVYDVIINGARVRWRIVYGACDRLDDCI